MSRSDARRASARLRLAAQARLTALAIGASALWFGHASLANTEDDVNNGSTDLTAPASYSGGAVGTSSDVTFTAAAYSPAAFTIGSALSIGTLDDLSTTALSISGSGLLTLDGGSNSVAPSNGGNSADLLFVATGGSLTITATPILLGATGNLDIAGTGVASLTGVISGANGLTKTGTGTLTLSGTNNYTGGTDIDSGTLAISADANLGGTAGTVTLNGGTLDTGANNFTLLHNIVVGASGGTINNTNNGNGIFLATTNQLSGSGALALTGNNGGTANTLIIQAPQDISGPISISNTRIQFNTSTATLGTSAITVNSNAELFITSSTSSTVTLGNAISFNGNNSDRYGAIRSFSNLTLNGNLTLLGNSYFSSQTGSTTMAINGSTTGAFILFLGNSTGSSSGANYVINGADSAGTTYINSGSLTLGTGTAAQGTMLSGGSGGTVQFVSGVGTFFAGALAGSEAIGLVDTASTAVTLSVGASQTYSGTLTGGAGSALTYTGSGEAHFQAAATGFTGSLNVNTTGNGKLDINTSLGSGGTINVGSPSFPGATLFVFGGTIANNTINLYGTGNGEGLGALRLDGGNVDSTSTINLMTNSTIGGYGGTAIEAGVITGVGTVAAGTATGFTKAGNSTLILSAANTFSGVTQVNGGTLNLSNALALQNSTYNTNGTLVFDQSVNGNAFTFGALNGGNSLALTNNASTAISLTAGGNNASTTYSGTLSGTGSNFTKAGTGTLFFDTAATLTGNFTIGNGILALNNGNQITAGSVIFGTAGAANNTTLTFSQGSRTFANAISTQGTGGTNTIQSQGGGQSFFFTGGITLANNLTLSTFGGSDGITVQTGAIGGTGNLETNVTTISAGGGAGAAGTVGSSGGGIALNSTVNNIGTITNDGNGTSTVGINGNIGSNVTNVIQNSATSGLLLSGVNSNASLTVANGVVGFGNTQTTFTGLGGTVTLGTVGAANVTAVAFSNYGRTFDSAFTTVGTGGTNTVQAQGDDQFFTFTGGFTLKNNLTLQTVGGSDSITVQTGAISGIGNLVTDVSLTDGAKGITGSTPSGTGGVISISSNVSTSGTITNVGAGTAGVTISGAISNASGLAQNSATSSLTLSGQNTFGGPTTVSAGTLAAGSTGAFSPNSAVVLANTAGAVLNTTGYNTTVGSLAGGGTTGGNVTLGAATLTTGGNNTSTSYAGVVSGTGGLTMTGTGMQTLTGANTYTGATTVNGGTLNLALVGTNTGAGSNTSGTYTAGTLKGTTALNVSAGGTLLLSASYAVNPAATVSLAGTGTAGTGTGAINVASGVLIGQGANNTMGMTGVSTAEVGALTLANNATIYYGGSSGTLVFSSLTANGKTLDIEGGTNFASASSASGVDGTNDRLIFITDPTLAVVQADISFGGAFDATEISLGMGQGFEIVPVPEPATWAAGLLGLAAVGYHLRRRMSSASPLQPAA